MAAGDALALPLKNTAFRVYFDVRKNDSTIITGWTGAAATLSKDGATSVAATNTPTEIATSWGMGYLDLTAAEMNTNNTSIQVTVTNSGAVPTAISLYPATDAMIRVNVIDWASAAVNALISGRVDASIGAMQSAVLNAAAFASNAITAAAINAGAIAQDVLNAVAASYNAAGTIGNKINAAGNAGDPWATAFPGSYLAAQFGGAFASMFNKLSGAVPVILNPGNLPSGVAGPFIPGTDYLFADGLQLPVSSPYTGQTATALTYSGTSSTGGEVVITGTLTDGQHGYIEFPAAKTAKMIQGNFKIVATLNNGHTVPWAWGTQQVLQVITP